MRVRLVQVDEIFRRMPFVARDVAREAGKDVRVALSGQDTEIDKFLVERMMDPILHLVRNAVSHGIEDPAARTAAGKPSQGVVRLDACTVGERVVIEVADDGAGIDAAAVAARARAAGIRLPDGPLDARTLTELLCEAGFSTRDVADRASGRGMGMAVVRTTVQELGGSLIVDTEVGLGTRFTVTLPVTLAITDALIALADGHTFAVPQSAVEEVIEIDASTIRQLEDNEIVPHRGRSLPLLRLHDVLGLAARQRAAPSRAGDRNRPRRHRGGRRSHRRPARDRGARDVRHAAQDRRASAARPSSATAGSSSSSTRPLCCAARGPGLDRGGAPPSRRTRHRRRQTGERRETEEAPA